MTLFTKRSFEAGQRVLSKRSIASRKTHGQFLTQEPLARFMAQKLELIADGDHILDPAMGSGTLLCAVIDHLIASGNLLEVWIDGFELDRELYFISKRILEDAVSEALDHGIKIHLNLFCADFVLNGLQFLRPSLLDTPLGQRRYDFIIANPPYFKINTDDTRRQRSEGLISGHTNIYTLFMALAAYMLHGGVACFIVPRSFCSGAYFAKFRRDFMEQVVIQNIHLFESRDEAFSADNVLQENVIITFSSNQDTTRQLIEISSSASLESLEQGVNSRRITREQFISPPGLFRLPTSDLDEIIMAVVDTWPDSLATYDMEISTGPVIPFRAKKHLLKDYTSNSGVPLIWMQHVKPGQVTWPINTGFHKSQRMLCDLSLMVKNMNYVLLRRFSAKEEKRRLIAAPYIASRYPFEWIGIENHLNYIHCDTREMTNAESIGLSALLNSGLIDRYFRISNGNTQVNATELRALPLPPLKTIQYIGEILINEVSADPDEIIFEILKERELLPDDLAVLRETRVV